jgi:hypothetical protein
MARQCPYCRIDHPQIDASEKANALPEGNQKDGIDRGGKSA